MRLLFTADDVDRFDRREVHEFRNLAHEVYKCSMDRLDERGTGQVGLVFRHPVVAGVRLVVAAIEVSFYEVVPEDLRR